MVLQQDSSLGSNAHNLRGIELADRGWLDEAAVEFIKAIQKDPQAADGHDNLASVRAEQGKLMEALPEFMEALKAEPNNAMAYHVLAIFLAHQGKDLEIALFRRALELEADFPEAHLGLARVLVDQGQYETASPIQPKYLT